MAKCQECGNKVSCGCVLKPVENRSYAVCPECFSKLQKQVEEAKKNGQEIIKPNMQGV